MVGANAAHDGVAASLQGSAETELLWHERSIHTYISLGAGSFLSRGSGGDVDVSSHAVRNTCSKRSTRHRRHQTAPTKIASSFAEYGMFPRTSMRAETKELRGPIWQLSSPIHIRSEPFVSPLSYSPLLILTSKRRTVATFLHAHQFAHFCTMPPVG